MDQIILEAEERTTFKKGAARRLRRNGKIPAVVYGHSGNSSVFVDAHDFHAKFKTVSENTIISLTLGDRSFDVLVKDYQEDLLKGTIDHIDFYEVEAGKTLRTSVPVRLEGTPEGVREGGVMEHLLYSVDVECLPKDIPHEIVLDVSNLSIGDSIHVEELDLPDAVRVLNSPEQVIVAVTTVRMEIEEEEAEEVEGEEVEGEEAEGEIEGEEAAESESEGEE